MERRWQAPASPHSCLASNIRCVYGILLCVTVPTDTAASSPPQSSQSERDKTSDDVIICVATHMNRKKYIDRIWPPLQTEIGEMTLVIIRRVASRKKPHVWRRRVARCPYSSASKGRAPARRGRVSPRLFD